MPRPLPWQFSFPNDNDRVGAPKSRLDKFFMRLFKAQANLIKYNKKRTERAKTKTTTVQQTVQGKRGKGRRGMGVVAGP